MNNKTTNWFFVRFLAMALLTLAAAKLEAQENLFSGKLLCNDEPIDFGYLLNIRTQKAIETNNGGLFKIEAQRGDTLKFRCLGYNDSLFVVDDALLAAKTIHVTKQTYALDEVTVHWFYSYAAFKQAFLNLKLDDKYKPFKYDINVDMRELGVGAKLASGGAGLSIPLSGIGLAFKSRDELRAQQLALQEKTLERYNRLISHQNIGDFTHLKGQALDSFIVYLRTKANINPLLSEYDMMAAVKLAFISYVDDPKNGIDTTTIR